MTNARPSLANSLRPSRNTGTAPNAMNSDWVKNSAPALGNTQNTGTRNTKMSEEWSPIRLRPINVTNGALNRDINQMPWS